jgi:hypothetical protein
VTVTCVVAVLTMLLPRWIEVVFGVDPDGGSGAVEWAVVMSALLGSATFTWLVRYEWRVAARAEG